MSWMENDTLFVKELKEGWEWQRKVADYLRGQGLAVVEPKYEYLHGIKLTETQINLEDLECVGEVIEIKSRKFKFTGPNDFPYSTAMVDTVKSWDGKKVKPFAYIHVSRPTKAGMWISGLDSSGWEKIARRDHGRGIDEVSYACSPKMWRKIPELVEILRAKQGATIFDGVQ